MNNLRLKQSFKKTMNKLTTNSSLKHFFTAILTFQPLSITPHHKKVYTKVAKQNFF